MRNKLILFAFLATILFGCGEAGVQLDVTKTSTVTIQVSSALVNADADNQLEITQTVNFGDEDFEDYIGDAESVKIDKLTYEFSGYTNTSSDLVLLDVSLGTGNLTDNILSLTGLVVENTGVVLAYEEGNPSSALSAAQVVSLEDLANQILNRENITFRASTDFTQDIDGDFTIEFNFDVTLRVSEE